MNYPRKSIWFQLLALLAVTGFLSCVENSETDPEEEEGGLIVARLQQADSCEDLLTKQ